MLNCPSCRGDLEGRKQDYTCRGCGARWAASFTCDVCGNVPEVIEGCGSVSFFCPGCRTLKSRDAMNVSYTRREE